MRPSTLASEIQDILIENGFTCTMESAQDHCILKVELSQDIIRIVLPIDIAARSSHEALLRYEKTRQCINGIIESYGTNPIIITEDRWYSQKEMMTSRLLAHLERFTPIYARNCEVRRIEKDQAAAFLESNHSYGDAACRYRYGLFLKRHTGRISMMSDLIESGTLVAVAEFSNARKWIKGDLTIKSYEWIRYASLPGLRISGGMGKILKQFIKEVKPDDIMSYADTEWSEGSVYEKLGFILEGVKEPVLFQIRENEWTRFPLKKGEVSTDPNIDDGNLYFQNFGSNKYRLKLTDYK